MRRKIVTVMLVTAVLAVGLFALPLAVLVAKYLIDDERGELTHAADLTALHVTADLARGHRPSTLPAVEPDISLTFYDRGGERVIGGGPALAEPGVQSALAGSRITDGDPGGDFTVYVPVSDDGAVAGAVRATSSRTQAWLRILTAWLIMATLAGVTLGAVWFVARRQAGRLAAPIERLSAVAAGIGQGSIGQGSLDSAAASGVPEIDDVAASLSRSAHRVERTLARERAFSADASHQLRTPLAGLRLQLETALEGPDTNLRAAITTAITAADRLEQTILDLLALSRDTPAGDRELPLPTLLDELRRDHHDTLAAAGRGLTVVADPELPAAAASPQAMRQVVDVLVDNALRHGQGTVTVTAREAAQAIAVDVTDEGRVERPDQLFVRRSATAAGHGIGLALARSLTEAEGGRLLLSRQEPTTFTLLLPLTPASRSPARSSVTTPLSGRSGTG
ncbi:MAG TPA: HAMP domain-containing sensor histidine kinase [Pseudonocardia sp.]